MLLKLPDPPLMVPAWIEPPLSVTLALLTSIVPGVMAVAAMTATLNGPVTVLPKLTLAPVDLNVLAPANVIAEPKFCAPPV